MKVLAIVIYAASFAFSFPLVFRCRLLDKPKPLNFGPLGTLKPTSRDLYFLGSVLLLVAVGYTFVLLQNASLGIIIRWFDGPGITYISIKDDSAQFKLQLYLQSAFTPFLLAIGVRVLAYGRSLGTQR